MDTDRPMTPAEQSAVDTILSAYERFAALTDDSPAGWDTARAYVALHPEQTDVVYAYATECAEQEIALLASGQPSPFADRRGVQLRDRHLLAHILGDCRCDHA